MNIFLQQLDLILDFVSFPQDAEPWTQVYLKKTMVYTRLREEGEDRRANVYVCI